MGWYTYSLQSSVYSTSTNLGPSNSRPNLFKTNFTRYGLIWIWGEYKAASLQLSRDTYYREESTCIDGQFPDPFVFGLGRSPFDVQHKNMQWRRVVAVRRGFFISKGISDGILLLLCPFIVWSRNLWHVSCASDPRSLSGIKVRGWLLSMVISRLMISFNCSVDKSRVH